MSAPAIPAAYSLPPYREIPTVGLYLEQVAKYLSEALSPLGYYVMTKSMISNYVKKKLIASPVKKQYSREQIASLLFIGIAKIVLSLEDIRLLMEHFDGFRSEKAYTDFCDRFSGVLRRVSDGTNTGTVRLPASNDAEAWDALLESMMVSAACRIHLENRFMLLRAKKEEL